MAQAQGADPPVTPAWAAPVLLGLVLLLGACATPPFRPETRPVTLAYAQGPATSLAQRLAPASGADPLASALRLLVNGHEAFAARAALADQAEHTLDLQYYIVAADSTASALLHRLQRAAQRGVRVRLLIDDVHGGLPEAELAALAGQPGIEVRLFNPFRLRGPVSRGLELLGNADRLNRRMHNKLWIADNAVAVMGGRNLANAYFDLAPDSGFADLDLLVAGRAVLQASHSFDSYWNSAWAVPIADVVASPDRPAKVLAAMARRATDLMADNEALALRTLVLGQQLRDNALRLDAAPARLLADAPPTAAPADGATVRGSAIFPALGDAITAAQREVIMVSPYLVPGERSVSVLCTLARRGVAVRILTNSLASTDVPAVHAGYARYRPSLLACGVALHELRPVTADIPAAQRRLSSGGSLHAKAVVVDRQQVFMGSMNLDPRSLHLNTEVALQADSRALGAQLAELFDESTEPDQVWRLALAPPGQAESPLQWHGLVNGRPEVLTNEPGASAWRRAAVLLLGWLIDEDWL